MAKPSAAEKVIAELEAERQLHLDTATRATDNAQTILAVIHRLRSVAKPAKTKTPRKSKPVIADGSDKA